MEAANKTEKFIQQLAEHQNRLYGYVYSMLGNHALAGDVIQETNLVLWRRLADFDPDQPFAPWAMGIARYQVLASLRDQKRDRLLLDAELAEQMSGVIEQEVDRLDDYREPLRKCLAMLSPQNRELIELRYFSGKPIADISVAVDRSVSSVKVTLLRVRRQLMQCVQSKLEAIE